MPNMITKKDKKLLERYESHIRKAQSLFDKMSPDMQSLPCNCAAQQAGVEHWDGCLCEAFDTISAVKHAINTYDMMLSPLSNNK
jgi:hypothetical protein